MMAYVQHAEIIYTVAGTGSSGFSGDGGVATSAKLNNPDTMSVDTSGNMYIADEYNHRIRKVLAATNVISTIAGTGSASYSGDESAATSATLKYPVGVDVDASGNVYIADSSNNRIRKITISTGIITTVAGTGSGGYTGDGNSATSAKLNNPYVVVLDASANLYIVDYDNNRVRKVTVSTGIISTLVGSASTGYNGDGGAATSASINMPSGIALDTSGIRKY